VILYIDIIFRLFDDKCDWNGIYTCYNVYVHTIMYMMSQSACELHVDIEQKSEHGIFVCAHDVDGVPV
jgi:hypothetical protein